MTTTVLRLATTDAVGVRLVQSPWPGGAVVAGVVAGTAASGQSTTPPLLTPPSHHPHPFGPNRTPILSFCIALVVAVLLCKLARLHSRC